MIQTQNKIFDPVLNITTYNIHHGCDIKHKNKLDQQINFLAGLNSHIYCIQEVDKKYGQRSGNVDQPNQLCQLGIYNKFVNTIANKYGHMAISKIQPKEIKIKTLINLMKKEERKYLLLRYQGLILVSTHLSNISEQNKQQLHEILKDLQEFKNQAIIIAGDLNIDFKKNKGLNQLIKEHGFQTSNINQITLPKYAVNIDHFLYNQKLICTHTTVIKNDLSDHYPLIAQFKLKN